MTKTRALITLAAAAVSMLLPAGARAQKDVQISPADRASVIRGVEAALRASYVYREGAAKMIAALERHSAAHEYDSIAQGPRFAERLTRDLVAAGRDNHVYVSYTPDVHPIDPPLVKPDSLQPPRSVYRDIERNFVNDGFIRAEILPGNIGYLRVDVLLPRELMERAAPAAFRFVHNTDALILDLRSNGGAIGPSSVPTFAGYFFEHATTLDVLRWRSAAPMTDISSEHVAGPKYTGKPIYILTSGHTASGAEAFAYHMKAFKRATIVGMPTMGAANPGVGLGVAPHFELFVPIGHVENVLTKANWDYTGVIPDVRVAAIDALDTARMMELHRLLASTKDDRGKTSLQAALDDVTGSQRLRVRVHFKLDGYRRAKSVVVSGSFNYKSEKDTPMLRGAHGWDAEAQLPPGRYTYHFIVDGVRLGDRDEVMEVR